MNPLQDYQRQLREQLPYLAARYGVCYLGLFGSHVRGTQRSDSDLDVLVSFDQAPSLLRLIELENRLSDLLGIKVDLAVRESLKPRIGKRILEEVLSV